MPDREFIHMQEVGYLFFGHDNMSYAFAESHNFPRCACGLHNDKWKHVPLCLQLMKKGLDVSTTYDGAKIVSQRVHQLYVDEGWTGLEFRPLPMEPGYFQIIATTSVTFDAIRRKTRFIDPCPSCGRFRSVSGATPVFLKDPNNTIPRKGFARSDLEFGTGTEMHPLMMCGVEVGRRLKAAKLKGLDLEQIRN